ncbi:MAG: hypothetical protein RI942_2053 [Pseudomonadota bacterium]
MLKNVIKSGLGSLVLVLVLVGCSQSDQNADQDQATGVAALADPNQPVASPIDDRAYRALTLDNGLQVLLISDVSTQKAAAALDVYVGSGDNPEGRGGLAHFLEHMLFLGTEKYPDPAEYEQYITEHGGNRNAYTSFDHTNYFFDINVGYLPEALDRFAQFFVSPNLDKEYVDREMNAVQAEYQMGLKSDGRRGLDVLQTLMHDDHPYSQFSVGSLESLADRPDAPILEDLFDFYERYYTADNMRLVVLGNESLDELQALVESSFAGVPAGNVKHDPVEVPIFPEELLPAKVAVEPTAANRSVEMIFPIKDYRADYLTNPERYVGHLVGHEGPNSLLAQLKAEGLAESLSAGASFRWRGGALFYIEVKLTEAGVKNYQRVVQMTHTALAKFRNEGVQEWVFDELKQLSDLNFRFQEKGEPIRYVSGLADTMHDYDKPDWLRGGRYLETYNAALIQDLLDSLTPDKVLVTVSYPGIETDTLSPYYETPYAVASAADWSMPLAEEDPAVAAIAMPDPNRFIAERVDVIDEEGAGSIPVLRDTSVAELWFQHDNEFNVPRGALYVNFRSEQVAQSSMTDTALELYTALVSDKANDFAYAAQLAGLNSSIYRHGRGLSLRVNGYNDKQLVLLSELLSVMRDMPFDEARFNNIKAERIRQIENKAAQRPASQIMGALREALNHSSWSDEEQLVALNALTLDQVKTSAKAFWTSVQPQVLLYGNYSEGDIAKTQGALKNLAPQTDVELPSLRITQLPSDKRQQLTQVLEHNDSVISWYLQGQDRSVEQQALYALTGQALKSGFFQQLRTEQQLGYIASAFSWSQSRVPGLVMIIQSPSHSSQAVKSAIDGFLARVPTDITEDAFSRHKSALVAEIVEPDKNLSERAEFLWQSLGEGDTSFASREALAQAVQAIAYADWRAFFERDILGAKRSLLVVAPGKYAEVPSEQTLFETPKAVKEANSAFAIEF